MTLSMREKKHINVAVSLQSAKDVMATAQPLVAMHYTNRSAALVLCSAESAFVEDSTNLLCCGRDYVVCVRSLVSLSGAA